MPGYDVGMMPARLRTNLKDVVAEAVRTRIFAGQFPPGTRIDQEQLARDLRISKLPVREALIALEQEGWVRNVPRQGSFVAVITPNDVLDHYRIFGTVSALAIERAVTVLTDADIDRIEAIAKSMAAESDPAVQRRLNDEFHAAINRAGCSARLASTIRALAAGIPARFFEPNSGWESQSAIEQHERIVETLRRRDAAAAAAAVLEHFTDAGQFAVKQLGNVAFWSRHLTPQ